MKPRAQYEDSAWSCRHCDNDSFDYPSRMSQVAYLQVISAWRYVYRPIRCKPCAITSSYSKQKNETFQPLHDEDFFPCARLCVVCRSAHQCASIEQGIDGPSIISRFVFLCMQFSLNLVSICYLFLSPSRMGLQVSWNIDCLNYESKIARVHEACAILLQGEASRLPDVILLQVSSQDQNIV